VPALTLGSLRGHDSGLTSELPATRWPDGIMADKHDLSIPPTARAGSLALDVGRAALGRITVTEPPRDFHLPSVAHRLDLSVGSFGTLVGYDAGQATPGRSLPVTLVWQARATTPASYKVFVHVLDRQNHVVAQRDDFPAAGAMPTTFWLPGQVVVDRYRISLPRSLPSALRLEVGMYDPVSGKRVPLGASDHVVLPLGG
ncbi:MAG: hypothetical protein ACYDAG_12520, partial [Chloroflexota bacterium]